MKDIDPPAIVRADTAALSALVEKFLAGLKRAKTPLVVYIRDNLEVLARFKAEMKHGEFAAFLRRGGLPRSSVYRWLKDYLFSKVPNETFDLFDPDEQASDESEVAPNDAESSGVQNGSLDNCARTDATDNGTPVATETTSTAIQTSPNPPPPPPSPQIRLCPYCTANGRKAGCSRCARLNEAKGLFDPPKPPAPVTEPTKTAKLCARCQEWTAQPDCPFCADLRNGVKPKVLSFTVVEEHVLGAGRAAASLADDFPELRQIGEYLGFQRIAKELELSFQAWKKKATGQGTVVI